METIGLGVALCPGKLYVVARYIFIIIVVVIIVDIISY